MVTFWVAENRLSGNFQVFRYWLISRSKIIFPCSIRGSFSKWILLANSFLGKKGYFHRYLDPYF